MRDTVRQSNSISTPSAFEILTNWSLEMLSYVARAEVPIQEAQKIIAITVGCGLAAFALGLIVIYRLYMQKHKKKQKQIDDVRGNKEGGPVQNWEPISPRDISRSLNGIISYIML